MAGRLERFGTVGAAGARDHRDLPDPHATEPVPEHELLRPETRPGLPLDLPEPGHGGDAVDLVVERHHPGPPTSIGPDAAGEDDDPAAGPGG